jgi:hypothetical protein
MNNEDGVGSLALAPRLKGAAPAPKGGTARQGGRRGPRALTEIQTAQRTRGGWNDAASLTGRKTPHMRTLTASARSATFLPLPPHRHTAPQAPEDPSSPLSAPVFTGGNRAKRQDARAPAREPPRATRKRGDSRGALRASETWTRRRSRRRRGTVARNRPFP